MANNTAQQPLISIQGLYKIFGKKAKEHMAKVHAGMSKDELLAETGHTLGLRDINLNIHRGKIFVIMGLSGSGKSTLIRHFNRLIDPTEGKILVDGVDVMELNAKELQNFRRHKMSMVFQKFGLLPHRTVVENVAYGLHIQGEDKAVSYAKAKEWLETVGLAGYEDLYPNQLSGGQQQRVGLARALCTDAEILLMDEAFSALDPLIRSEMQDQLIELQEKLHKTIVFITHDLDEALRIGDRIAILKDGALIQEGAPEDILLEPATDYIENFVRDVNRARALTVKTVMKPPVLRITAETIGEALAEMRKSPRDYAYYETDEGYQGVLLQETLEEALEDKSPINEDSKICAQVLEDVPAISSDDYLEAVLTGTLESEVPLPVLNEDGAVYGQISRKTLASALEPPVSEDQEAEEQQQDASAQDQNKEAS